VKSEESTFVKHVPCPNCNSSDGNSLWSDGHQYCFVCETFTQPEGSNYMAAAQTVSPIKGVISNTFSKGSYSDIKDRALKAATCKAYSVQVEKENNFIYKHIYPYYDSEGNHVSNKVRLTSNKSFLVEGSISRGTLFGQNSFSPKGKYITVCEGELDALSVFQMFGSKWPSVSVKSAASAVRDCKDNLEYLDSFETIVLCFDNDKAGKQATTKVAELFQPHKCRIVNMKDFKDANEYLVAGKREEFVRLWWAAVPYTPAGIINLNSLGDALYDENYCETVTYPWTGLNDKLYGMRTGELITFTSGAGMGKSSVIRELMHHIMLNSKDNIGILALEESTKNTAFNLMSVEAEERLYISEIREKFTREQLHEWEKKTIGTGRFFAFDHFGSISNNEIMNRIRYMAKALECKWIVLDHLSILVSGQEDVDERRSIDILMTKMRSLVEETQIGLLLVSHLRRTTADRGHEEGREVSLSHLRGSQSIAHLSDAVIALERNQQADDPVEAHTTAVRILKNRYTGETGIGTYLFYNRESGRLSEVSNPFTPDETDNAVDS